MKFYISATDLQKKQILSKELPFSAFFFDPSVRQIFEKDVQVFWKLEIFQNFRFLNFFEIFGSQIFLKTTKKILENFSVFFLLIFEWMNASSEKVPRSKKIGKKIG